MPRLYETTRRLDAPGLTWATVTTKEYNPFRNSSLLLAALWWLDDWGHRQLGRVHRFVMRPLCNFLDRRLW